MDGASSNCDSQALSLRGLIQKLILAAGIADSVSSFAKIGSGRFNVAYRVAFKGRQSPVLLRVCKTKVSGLGQEFAAEEFVAPLLEGFGVSAPRLLYVCHDAKRFGFPFAVLDFIEGRTLADALADPAFTIQELNVYIEALARTLSTVHRIQGLGFGSLNAVTHEPGEPGFVEKLFRQQLDAVDRHAPDLAADYRCALPYWLELLADVIQDMRSPSLVHGDMHGRNILVTPDQSLALIDWESAGYGMSASDLSQLQYFVLGHERVRPNVFLQSYIDGLGWSIDLDRLRSAMDIWQCYWQCRMAIFQAQLPRYWDDYFGCATDHFRDVRAFLTRWRNH
jgi:aminoglycoside phosphotransferase (APT) family kinase protein